MTTYYKLRLIYCKDCVFLIYIESLVFDHRLLEIIHCAVCRPSQILVSNPFYSIVKLRNNNDRYKQTMIKRI